MGKAIKERCSKGPEEHRSRNGGRSGIGVTREGSMGNLGFKRFLGRQEGSLRAHGRGRHFVAKCVAC